MHKCCRSFINNTFNMSKMKLLLECTCIYPWTCCSNAKTILQDNVIQLINFEMTYNLGKELVLSAIRRYSQSNRLKITVINKTWHVLGINELSAHPQPENINPTSGRYFKCVGKKSFKAKREMLNIKLKKQMFQMSKVYM